MIGEAAPRLRCVPHDDAAFAQAVTEVWSASRTGERPSVVDLEAALQAAYPAVAVRVQDPLSRLGLEIVWYVYRDGHFSGPMQREAEDAAAQPIDLVVGESDWRTDGSPKGARDVPANPSGPRPSQLRLLPADGGLGALHEDLSRRVGEAAADAILAEAKAVVGSAPVEDWLEVAVAIANARCPDAMRTEA